MPEDDSKKIETGEANFSKEIKSEEFPKKEVVKENAPEKAPEFLPQEKEEEGEKREGKVEIPSGAPVTPTTPYKSPTFLEIENILSEDLDEVYFSLPPEKRKQFKERGEETASRIEKMIKAVRINAHKILNLIKKWLKIIPGVNQFFLEQEAKIKADKILDLSQRK
ncbi:MAG: hypothetical protein PHD51_00980 [Patescibacteria group bacterium]|nr:hypothetical protein [Patescibacteria group bacterium]MDD5490563.1 hypothetical protein [Patescibacteria group bacterium]